MIHRRTVYKLLDVLSDFGGLQGIVQTVVPYIVSNFAEHSFFIRAFQLLFLLKSGSVTVRKKFMRVKKQIRRVKKHEFDSMKYKLPM